MTELSAGVRYSLKGLEGIAPSASSVVELIDRQCARTPGAVAVSGAERRIGYAELAGDVSRLARRLRQEGVRPGQVVGVSAERSPELVVALLAVLKAGGAFLYLDPALPAERLGFMVEDADAALVLGGQERQPDFGGRRALPLDAQPLADEVAEDVEVAAAPGDLAYVIYTSGSTGRPKGILVEHAGLLNYVEWLVAEFSAGQPVTSLLHSPLGFDFSLSSLFLPLVTGGELRLAPAEFEHESLAEAIQDQSLDLVRLTPSHIEVLRAALDGRRDLPGARVLLIGGEVLRADQVAALRALFPSASLYNHYGPAEAIVGRCFQRLDESEEFRLADYAPGDPVPVGRPIPHTELVVEQGPDGAGELLIAGLGLARGYLNLPELTASSFVRSGADGRVYYRTGDQAVVDGHGRLTVLGRADDQVKVRGYRVELGEIEAALRTVDGVRAAAVVRTVRPHEALWAFVVGPGQSRLDAPELRADLQRRLPAYMVPHRLLALDELPLSAHRKLDRAALVAEAERIGLTATDDVAPPAGGGRLAEAYRACAQVLGVAEVRPTDNFLALGGDSITAMKLAAACRRLGIGLRSVRVLATDTLAEAFAGIEN
ncbi:non-ribosomal peptide synthetase [Streptomyces sp. NRRL WC-3742]|uniref:non-ribosomal peptide synthetase n=1 Tax=Streptomyces sp. NRRL WC-3742 TaxID=1463934 RepID=UPI00068DC220|nr:non-ribosomal peptide synthetase [Streptomyces sp. NRRL WC-3742]